MDISADTFGMVKTNTKGLCKDTIDNMTEDWLGNSYLLFIIKLTMPADKPIIAIDYKYNYHKVLYFVTTEDEGRKRLVLPIYIITLTSLLMFTFDLFLLLF